MDLTEIWHKTWRDKKGKVVIWQTPSIPLIAWLVFTVASLLVNGKTADIFSYLGVASLVLWSLLEIFRGVNYFRRALGALVLVWCILTIIHIV